VSASVRPPRPSSPVRFAEAKGLRLFPASFLPQLSQPVEKPPSGPRWVHDIKLDGYRMAARTDGGRAQLLTRTGLDWTDKYPSIIAALANVRAKTAYIDGELCGVDEAGLPSFAQTQAATDGERDVRLVYYAFDLLHLNGRDVSRLPLVERKAMLEPILAGKPGLQFNGLDTGDGELILKHAGKLGFEGVVSKTIDAPYAPGLGSHSRTHPPEFRKELDLQHSLEVAASRRAACAPLEAEDALDRRDVVETPASEIILEVDQRSASS
jgi:ATP-dependent DNA ligase